MIAGHNLLDGIRAERSASPAGSGTCCTNRGCCELAAGVQGVRALSADPLDRGDGGGLCARPAVPAGRATRMRWLLLLGVASPRLRAAARQQPLWRPAAVGRARACSQRCCRSSTARSIRRRCSISMMTLGPALLLLAALRARARRVSRSGSYLRAGAVAVLRRAHLPDPCAGGSASLVARHRCDLAVRRLPPESRRLWPACRHLCGLVAW